MGDGFPAKPCTQPKVASLLPSLSYETVPGDRMFIFIDILNAMFLQELHRKALSTFAEKVHLHL